MATNSTDLLRGLASGVLPGGIESTRQRRSTPTSLSSASFSQLFESLAKAGSGLPVTVAGSSGVELTNEQLARVAQAADKAEAQGAQRALVMIDGQALQLDVGVRQITGKVDLNATDVLPGIDAVVWASGQSSGPSGAAAAKEAAGTLRFKSLQGWNPSLLRVLGAENASEAGSEGSQAA